MKLLQQAARLPSPDDMQSGIVRTYSFLPQTTHFPGEVMAGLSAPRKTLPARWRYDDAGLRAMEALCSTPEFYLARHERALLAAHLGEAVTVMRRCSQLIEIGPACGLQVGMLIEALQPPLYLDIAVDVAAAEAAAARLSEAYPGLHIAGLLADPTQRLVLPTFAGIDVRGKVLYLSAVAAGSYTPDDLSLLLRSARDIAGHDGYFITCIDLKKPRKVLEAAGNDAQGLAARWNMSLLHRVNRELGGDFQVSRFHHVSVHNEMLGCTGFYLESDYAQFVTIEGRRIDFAEGEVMLTGITSQYSAGEFESLAVEAGFKVEKMWIDAARWTALYLLGAV
jgi:dimethylhistidine N-methyltransferase